MFDQLPTELLLHLTGYLHLLDFVRLYQVNRFWRDTLSQIETWQTLIQTRLLIDDTTNNKQVINQRFVRHSAIARQFLVYTLSAHQIGLALPGLEQLVGDYSSTSLLAGYSTYSYQTINYFYRFDPKAVVKGLACAHGASFVRSRLSSDLFQRHIIDVLHGLALRGDVSSLIQLADNYDIMSLAQDLLRSIVAGGGLLHADHPQYGVPSPSSLDSYKEFLLYFPSLDTAGTAREMLLTAIQFGNQAMAHHLFTNYHLIIWPEMVIHVVSPTSADILLNLDPNFDKVAMAFNILHQLVRQANMTNGFFQVNLATVKIVLSQVPFEDILETAIDQRCDKTTYLLLSNFPTWPLDVPQLLLVMNMRLSRNIIYQNLKIEYVELVPLMYSILGASACRHLIERLKQKFGLTQLCSYLKQSARDQINRELVEVTTLLIMT